MFCVSRSVERWAKVGAAGVLSAVVMGITATGALAMSDSDGYVPVRSSCWAGNQLAAYNWYSDGYTVSGSVVVNECALDRLGAGPMDRQNVIAHELGHARGLGHSSDPSSVMYPYYIVKGY